MSGDPIHFILTRGKLTWQYRRAIETAKVHERPIWLWRPALTGSPIKGVETHYLHGMDDVKDVPASHAWDVIAYLVLFYYGGTCLGMDTISVAPMMDLASNKELLVGLDVPDFPWWHDGHQRWVDHPYNNNGISARKGSPMVGWLLEEARMRIARKETQGSPTGPNLLTELIERNPERVQVAPFPQLCGFEGSYIWEFYQGAEPPKDTRVVHLFASAYPKEFATYGKAA